MQRCFVCSLSAQTYCSEKKKMFVPSRSLQGTDEYTSQLSCVRGKAESVQVFGLEAEAFQQGVVQKPLVPINTMLLCNNRKTNSDGGNAMAVFMLLSVEVHVAESKLSFQIFPVFFGSSNQKSFPSFCIAATILCKTDYGSNDYYVDLIETDFNLRES